MYKQTLELKLGAPKMAFRELTHAEVREIVRNFKDERNLNEGLDPEDVRRFVEFARKYFVGTPHRVRIRVDAEYNDEYYTPEVVSMTVYDKEGNRLKPNPRAVAAPRAFRSIPAVESLDDDDVDDLLRELLSELEAPGVDEDGYLEDDYENPVFNFYATSNERNYPRLFVLEKD